jgi:hypothetical protein
MQCLHAEYLTCPELFFNDAYRADLIVEKRVLL